MVAAIRKSVLVADDQPLIRWAIGRTLEGLGFDPVFAATHRDAVARATDAVFALAIVGDPIEDRPAGPLLEALKTRGTCRVLVLSDSGVPVGAPGGTSVRVVQKPFSLASVVDAVGTLTRGAD